MRLSVFLLLCSLAGVVGGGALIGRWALGLAIVVDSVAVGVFALLRDAQDRAEPSVHDADLVNILERARRAS